jgi:hypothetical protein
MRRRTTASRFICASIAILTAGHGTIRPSPLAAADSGTAALSIVDAVKLLPEKYRPDAVKALGAAEQNQAELIEAIRRVPPKEREAIAFLLAHMPAGDLTTFKADLLVENIDYAYRARQAVSWGRDVPDELFFNDVLPYANLNERRENWRKDFYERFLPVVKDCRTPGEAALVLNHAVFETLKVKYHPTKRPKPDQSPSESCAAGYASCTGLSILLADACRAVCVPARVVGVPEWTKTPGNHTWVEAWDRQWNFIGASELGPFNQTWFAGNAAQADGSKPEHRIYAASFAPTGTPFPLVWAPANKDVPAFDVTPFYTQRTKLTFQVFDKPDGQPQTVRRLAIRRGGALVASDTNNSSFQFDLARGEKYTAEMTAGDEKPVVREFTATSDGATVKLTLFPSR